MFYQGNILKLHPLLSREEATKQFRGKFIKVFQGKYADKFDLVKAPKTTNDRVQLKCKNCGHITYRFVDSILKGKFNKKCEYCQRHKEIPMSPRKTLKRILSCEMVIDYLSNDKAKQRKQVIIKCKCGHKMPASYSRIINKSIRQQCPKCGRNVYK
ncbi:hypothetical protein HMPREF0494_1796 [Limosilactobacillus antri DSM 16041]|uniref:Uncharacterized protein n=1 Tax=Limosilactobacillus antri DSM 16041 TaxID=525309 RepID=C8P902_9LACO|nr:hypothetical protein HMPREF0494_1796 [Limosilactobacillus antri DSM 16041]